MRDLIETPGYINHRDEQIYYLLLSPLKEIKGKVVLAGPFASERPHTTILWVKWARFLSGNGYEVMLFDYRGTGESTGDFEKMNFDDWLEDLEICGNWLLDGKNKYPLIIHGLGIGGLFASLAFKKGLGNRLLLWSPVHSANQMLYKMLRTRCASDFVLYPEIKRKTRKDYIDDFESNKMVEVDGFSWSKKLWKNSFEFNIVLPESKSNNQNTSWKSVELNRSAGSLYLKGSLTPPDPTVSVKPKPLCPDLSTLFQSNVEWINEQIIPMGES